MIGLGGWGGRNEKDGPYVYYDAEGKLVTDDSEGGGGKHGKRHEFPITVREPEHPIVKDIPPVWLHAEDECYARLRGPAENLTILATGDDQTVDHGGRHEPVLMTVGYGEGRVFHTTLGHDAPALECVGFITTFTRGAEWAATGNVTIPVPDDFPTADQTSSSPYTP